MNKYKLNHSRRFNMALGIAIMLNALLDTAAFSAILGPYQFDVTIKNEIVGNIIIGSEADRRYGELVVGGFEVTKKDNSGTAMTIEQLQNQYELKQLNWLQIITFDPYPPRDYNGRQLFVPFIDPPNGGYQYIQTDAQPWYWEEVEQRDFSKPPYSPSASILQYVDTPVNIYAKRIDFVTFLVGDFGNKTYDTLGGFSWSINTGATLSADGSPMYNTIVNDIKTRATFTQEYAALVQKEFGYTKVHKLPTFESNGHLSTGTVNPFILSGQTPLTPFLAWTDNQPVTNPQKPLDTVLGTFNSDGKRISYNNDGGLFFYDEASGLKGSANDDGRINLKVTGYRDYNFDGQTDGKKTPHCQEGNYKLLVKLYDSTDFPGGMHGRSLGADRCSPPVTCTGGSGGGGCYESEPGEIQEKPILTYTTSLQWKIFRYVTSGLWYDPDTNYGFEFQSLEDTLFTDILDFPVGFENPFSVWVGDNLLGNFNPGESVDFVALLGQGVSNFKITGIEAGNGATATTPFPIQIAFNGEVGSFKMRPIYEEDDSQRIPEPAAGLGLLALGTWAAIQGWKINKSKD